MPLVDRIREVVPLDFSRVRPFVVDNRIVGWMTHATAELLAPYADTFVVATGAVTLGPALVGFDARSASVDDVVRRLHEAGIIERYRGERYAVSTSFEAPPLLAIDRGAATLFGIRSYGVHLNGYVGHDEAMHIWVARRADDKATWPGKLDHIAAGGQPIGLGLVENLVKEADEEAGIPEPIARRARSAGSISFLTENRYGIDNGVIFSYDLELPADFLPQSRDGEVASFELWPVDRVMERLATTDDFVFDSALISIDFLMRHGFIAPDDPDHLEIGLGLNL